jgi:hypothetical protein
LSSIHRPPAPAFLAFDHKAALKCPFCNEDYIHLEIIRVGARQEDQPAYLITVDAVAGTVQEQPAFEGELSDRRHWVEMQVNCEMCAGGSIVFAQHKGQTLVSTRPA